MSDLLDSTLSSPLHGGASFSVRHRIYRAVWSATWLALAAWTPPPLHFWRRLLLRLFGAEIAASARIYGSARVWYPANLRMGDHAVLGRQSQCYNMDMITIGDFATISQFACLLGGTHDLSDPNFRVVTKPIKIGRYAWVAACAVVGPGVEVGDGAVLGAGAVTFSNLSPWTVYAGNPAKVIKSRAVIATISG